jgi:periplasmic protein TonB
MKSLLAEPLEHRGRAATATVATITLHGLVLALVILFLATGPQPMLPVVSLELPALLFVERARPGGGGGGGATPAAPKPIQIPRSTPPELVPVPTLVPAPAPPPLFVTSVITPNAVIAQAAGSNSVSLAPGGGDGAGRGLGNDRGNGVGPGRNEGFGGAFPAPGNGITTPAPIRSPSPTYTSEAMRAKVTGTVLLDVIVKADGTVGDVRVVRSLDRGLDQEAIRAARMWLFSPARDPDGRAVAVLVQLELSFRLH